MYRILTEDKNRADIVGMISALGIGASLFPCIGVWQGKEENGLVIELADISEVKVNEIAQDIKKMNSQDAVIIQSIRSKEKYV